MANKRVKETKPIKNATKKVKNRLEKLKDLDPTLKAGKFAPLIGGFTKLEFNSKLLPPEIVEDAAQELIKAYESMMPQAALALKARLDLALKAPVWAWPSGGSRDIFDTGRLMASGSVTWNGKALVITYTAPYADIVHDGGYIFPYGNKNLRPVYLPGRPWISSVLDGGGPVPRWSLADWLDANASGLVG